MLYFGFSNALCLPPMNALATFLGGERGRASRLARAIDLSPQFLLQLAKGTRPVPAERCAAIEVASNLAVRRWDLRPADWHLIWPELVGTEGAPQPPSPVLAAPDTLPPAAGQDAELVKEG